MKRTKHKPPTSPNASAETRTPADPPAAHTRNASQQREALAHAYVARDRLVFPELERSSALQNVLAAVKQRLKEQGALGDLEGLVEAHCDREGLLFRLAAIAAWQDRGKELHWSATGLSRYSVKQFPKKLHEAADLLEQFERVLPLRQIEGHPAPHIVYAALRAYADERERDSRMLLNPSKRTLEVAALACLVGYVKRATGRNYDEAVSGLIEAVTGKALETPLAQWRSKHKKDIALVGSGIVVPIPRT